jgi:GTP cyclohydrolase II
MASLPPLSCSAAAEAAIADILARTAALLQVAEAGRALPVVTLTYAQSLDGTLAAARGQPSAISGPASLRMTHALRAAHDGILVGVGTVLADDPSLTTRHWPGPSPVPIVLDTHLRTPPGCKLLTQRRPVLVFCGAGADADPAATATRRAALEAAGATVCPLPTGGDGRLQPCAVVAQLRAGVVLRGHSSSGSGEGGAATSSCWRPRSVMVEGGAGVLASFLAAVADDPGAFTAQAIVTVAPTLQLGEVRLPHTPRVAHSAHPLPLRLPRWHVLDGDAVVQGHLSPSH